MKLKTPPSLAVVTAGFLVVVAGCSKETADVPAPPPEASTPAAATVAAADGHLAQSKAALEAGDYDAAADALITAQGASLNEQQATAAAAQMRQLQSSIASAAAAGDPRAQAAAARLRQAAMRR